MHIKLENSKISSQQKKLLILYILNILQYDFLFKLRMVVCQPPQVVPRALVLGHRVYGEEYIFELPRKDCMGHSIWSIVDNKPALEIEEIQDLKK